MLTGPPSDDGFTTQLAGQATLNADFAKIAEEDARKGESIGIAVALIVLVIVFAPSSPRWCPSASRSSPSPSRWASRRSSVSSCEFNLFVTNIISMIGLAVGIDYSLFIVSRFREERKKGFEKLDAIGAAGATASRAVFFSGMTVVLALLGMFIIPTTIFRALAAGAIFVTLVSIAASMTLLPAMLAKLGDRIDWPWMSRAANVFVLLGLLLIGGIAGALVGIVAPPGVAVLAALRRSIGAAVVLTRVHRGGQRASWSTGSRLMDEGRLRRTGRVSGIGSRVASWLARGSS